MKRFYMILAAIAALAMTAQATVWESFDVGDWENPTTYNGSYFDMAPTNYYVAHTGVQMLYTPDMLADMQGKQNVRLTGLTFMFHCETFEDITRDIVIFVQEVDATEFAVNDEGIKQFFPIEVEPVVAEERTIEMLDFYGEDVQLSFRFNVDYTSGKSLLVTMAFDAQDDDNCTMGSDYAPFYTSGMGKAMTYTNNWTGFYDFTQGDDFPNATASLGCGTNVSLPLTRISYSYEESSEPYEIVPANPTADEWYDCGDESGFSRFYFTLPTTDVDGNLLNEENLSYAVWINDGFGNVYQFTFPAEDYTFDLNYDIDEVPYWIYSSAVDFHDYYVYMYRTNENNNPLFVRDDDHNGNIGIQAFYTYDRVKTSSEIAWLYEEVTPPEPPTPTDPTTVPSFTNTYTKPNQNAIFFEIEEGEPSTIYYRIIIDDVVQNVTDDNPEGWIEYTGEVGCYGTNGEGQDGHYVVEAYAIANGKLPSDIVNIDFNIGPSTGLDEMMSGKAVAGVRYFNMAGQEMAQPEGMTIVVTTYTDGTTSAVKVIK